MSLHRRSLPLLVILFAASGCSALIYEIVWYHLLQLAIGSTAVSLAFLLATFMGGLCIGSLALPRLVKNKAPGVPMSGDAARMSAYATNYHPLRIYGWLEFGIAACGIAVLFGVPYIVRLYISGAEHGLPGMLLRGMLCGICLLPPTILMGASLPAIVKWAGADGGSVSSWALLYGGNTLGAVFGCLLAGFYLLRVYDTAVATYVAAGINVAVALLSYAIAGRSPVPADVVGKSETARAEADGSRLPIYVAIALSGACALGAEVVWTRLMGIMLGATVYVFSIILAVFLVGLAIGSGAASYLLNSLRPRLALGWSQILLCGGIAWVAFMISDSLPNWPIDPMLATSPWQMFQLDIVRCLWAFLPPTFLWGASFSFALAAAASTNEESGRVAGGVYAANTFGAILGALIVSLALIPWIGTQQSQRVLLAASGISGLVVLAPYAYRQRSKTIAVSLLVSIPVIGFLISNVHAVPTAVLAYGRRIATLGRQSQFYYRAEGLNSSVVIARASDGSLEIDVNGHVEASDEPFDMKLQRMVGHLPGILHPAPVSVLGIGFGAGVSAGTFTRYPTIQKITICEIEPAIPAISTRYFGRQNYGVLNDARTRIVYDDARHYVLTTPEKFDIIASDPLDVFAKGTAALYTKEYFEAVRAHLNPGGFFTLYVPLYESDVRTVKSELATFFEAFPNATVWANTIDGQGYDMVFMGQVEPLKIDLDALQQRLDRPDYAPVMQSLRDVGITSYFGLLATYAGSQADLGRWTAGAEINRDRDLRLQYLAGWGINSNMQDLIYRQMLSHYRLPQNLFTGSPERMQRLIVAGLQGK